MYISAKWHCAPSSEQRSDTARVQHLTGTESTKSLWRSIRRAALPRAERHLTKTPSVDRQQTASRGSAPAALILWLLSSTGERH